MFLRKIVSRFSFFLKLFLIVTVLSCIDDLNLPNLTTQPCHIFIYFSPAQLFIGLPCQLSWESKGPPWLSTPIQEIAGLMHHHDPLIRSYMNMSIDVKKTRRVYVWGGFQIYIYIDVLCSSRLFGEKMPILTRIFV